MGVANLGVGHRFILQEVRERAGMEITAEIIRRVGKNAARNPTVTTLLGGQTAYARQCMSRETIPLGLGHGNTCRRVFGLCVKVGCYGGVRPLWNDASPWVRSALTVKTMAPDVGITSTSTEGTPKPAWGRPPQPESNPTIF